MTKPKILILEDDPLFAIKIEIMLENSNYEIVKICSDYEQIKAFFNTQPNVDLIITDLIINDEYLGLELIKDYGNNKFPIITMTNSLNENLYSDLVKEGISYLIKPFHRITLLAQIQKSLLDFKHKASYEFYADKYIFLTGKSGKQEKVNFEDIIYLESSGNYSIIFTNKGKYAKKISLNKFAENFLDERFIRIHHKNIINSKCIQSIKDKEVVLSNGISFKIGRSFSENIVSFVKNRKVSQ